MIPKVLQPVAHLPACVHLHIQFNDHAVLYQTAAQWIDDQESTSMSGAWFDWVSPDEKQRAIETDQVWTCQWYPTTPVGSCGLAASTYEALMAALAVIARKPER